MFVLFQEIGKMNKQIRGRKMLAMPNKKDKFRRPLRKQKYKKQLANSWE